MKKILLLSLIMLLLTGCKLSYRYETIKEENLDMEVTKKEDDEYVIYVYDKSFEKEVKLTLSDIKYWNTNVGDILNINKTTDVDTKNDNEIVYRYNINFKQNLISESVFIEENKIDVIVKDKDKKFENRGKVRVCIYYVIYIDEDTKIATKESIPFKSYNLLEKDIILKANRKTYKNKNNEYFYTYKLNYN